LDGSQKPHWSNDPNWPATTSPYSANVNGKKSDFFQTGHNFATNLGISTRTENTQSYFSYTYTDAEGIVPNNALESHNLSVRMNTKLLDKFSLDTKVNYIRINRENILHEGSVYENPISALYRMPVNIQTEDVRVYEFTDNEGLNKQHFWQPGINAPGNAYWALNNISHDHLEERLIGLISLKYDITDDFSILARSSIDRDNFHGTEHFATDSYIIADRGFYRTRDNRGFEWNSDVLLNYQRDLAFDLSLDVIAGGAVRSNERGEIIGNSGGRRSPLNVPNLFSFGNTSNITVSESFSRTAIQSLYGFATMVWKNAIYLDISGRNDWSSTLKSDNRSFFYPSVGVSVVASDLMATTPSWLSLLKLSASYAEVGNDTDPFQTVRAAEVHDGGTNGFLQLATTIPNANLLPEKTSSAEMGLEVQLFQNRMGFDLTYYKSNSTNQLFSIPLPITSGANGIFLNGADIQNQGIELVIHSGMIRSSRFNWDLTLNYAANKSEVKEIAEKLDRLKLGGGSALAQLWLIEGRPWGDIYARGFVRDEQGRVIVEFREGSLRFNGLPSVTNGFDVQVGNYNPDFLAGMRNSFSFGDFNFNFLIDIREGGNLISSTNTIMSVYGQTEETLIGREGGLVFGKDIFANETAVQQDGTPNTVATTAEKFWSLVGGCCAPVGEAFILDASNIRLREAVLGYNVPQSVLTNSPLSSFKVSLVGRNLFFISNKAGNVDPEVLVGTGITAEREQSFAPPTMREYGLNLKFGF
ncbi:MAG: SusC/RagA family TonB-linked outer membrane protein, partial [Saprospiraceae bacterium]|nr:SusC/RagA family TonB-linked outer membrane protein [Saprospiraceae bacterium]